MASRTLEKTDPAARRFEDIRLANLEGKPPLPKKPDPADKPAATDDEDGTL
jgi:hypothetical protein